MIRPQYGHIRFGRRSQIVQRVQIAERGFRNERSAVHSHAAERLGNPRGVARKKLVVFGRAQKADNAQFDDELVD